jgi:hypothetical protein
LGWNLLNFRFASFVPVLPGSAMEAVPIVLKKKERKGEENSF